MQHIIIDGDASSSSVNSPIINTEKYRTFSIQMVTDSTTSSGSTASGWLRGSHDKINWIPIVRLETKDGTKSDGAAFQTVWSHMRFQLESSEAGKKVNVYFSVGV